MIPRPFRLRLLPRLSVQPSSRPASSFSVPSRAILQPCKPLSSNNRGRLKSTKAAKADGNPKALPGGGDGDAGQSSLSGSTSSTLDTSTAGSGGVETHPSTRRLHTSTTQTVHPPRTQGRRRRKPYFLSPEDMAWEEREDMDSIEHDSSTTSNALWNQPDGNFTDAPHLPILTSPAQSAALVDSTPSHLPLPVPLGNPQVMYDFHTLYNKRPLGNDDLLFNVDNDYLRPWLLNRETPLIDAHLKNMFQHSSGGSTTLQEHTHLMANLPRLHRRNVSQSPSSDSAQSLNQEGTQGQDSFGDFQRAMAEKRTKDRLESDAEWNKIWFKVGDLSAKTSPMAGSEPAISANGARDLSTVHQDERGAIKNAVNDLLSTLRRLDSGRRRNARMVTIIGDDGEEEHLEMTSTLRKRKKKIKKHKYKKRRKVSDGPISSCSDSTTLI